MCGTHKALHFTVTNQRLVLHNLNVNWFSELSSVRDSRDKARQRTIRTKDRRNGVMRAKAGLLTTAIWELIGVRKFMMKVAAKSICNVLNKLFFGRNILFHSLC